MRIKEGFVLREILGKNVVSGEGLEQVNYSKLVTLNATATFLWKKAQEAGEFDANTLAQALKEEYPSVEMEKLLSDCTILIKQWKKADLLDE